MYWFFHPTLFKFSRLTTTDSVGTVIGTGIFSTPSSILGSVGSVGASLMLWVLGLVLSFCGLFVWLELGTMIPRSGGEKVYLEAMYRRPKSLATVIYATYMILLNISSGNCLVCPVTSSSDVFFA
jgi:L-type amino acid transporter 9